MTLKTVLRVPLARCEVYFKARSYTKQLESFGLSNIPHHNLLASTCCHAKHLHSLGGQIGNLLEQTDAKMAAGISVACWGLTTKLASYSIAVQAITASVMGRALVPQTRGNTGLHSCETHTFFARSKGLPPATPEVVESSRPGVSIADMGG